MVNEVKVAQFSGYVSEQACYHHGEASLNGAIVNMAQTFVGSNNANLLVPNGQFGSRLQGGHDSASERYIFTQLAPIARALFRKEDDAVLKYLQDDGTAVEPEFYVPVIPMSLVNGSIGIGTGFSTNIQSYDPRDVAGYLAAKLGRAEPPAPAAFVPWYRGFKGTVAPAAPGKFVIRGAYTRTGEDAIRITELPVGTWTMPYIAFLEKLEDGVADAGASGKRAAAPAIKSFTSNSTDCVVDIEVVFPPGRLAELGDEGVDKLLALSTTVSTTNMHMFDRECKLRYYATVEDILDAFFDVRLETYHRRKAHLVAEMSARLVTLSNKARYIELVLAGTIDLRKKSNDVIDALLESLALAREANGTYTYLVRMPMNSVSTENAAAILAERDALAERLEIVRATPVETTWLAELDELVATYTASLAATASSPAEGAAAAPPRAAARKPRSAAKK
jgi:DNA topoisomerase-2